MGENEDGFGLSVNLTWNKQDGVDLRNEIQEWLNKNPVEININLSADAIRGLEKMGKTAGEQTEDLKKKWKDFGTDISNLSTTFVKTTFLDDKHTHRLVMYRDEFGKLIQFEQRYMNITDEVTGKKTKQWVDSRQQLLIENNELVKNHELRKQIFQDNAKFDMTMMYQKYGSSINQKEYSNLWNQINGLQTDENLLNNIKRIQNEMRQLSTVTEKSFNLDIKKTDFFRSLDAITNPALAKKVKDLRDEINWVTPDIYNKKTEQNYNNRIKDLQSAQKEIVKLGNAEEALEVKQMRWLRSLEPLREYPHLIDQVLRVEGNIGKLNTGNYSQIMGEEIVEQIAELKVYKAEIDRTTDSQKRLNKAIADRQEGLLNLNHKADLLKLDEDDSDLVDFRQKLGEYQNLINDFRSNNNGTNITDDDILHLRAQENELKRHLEFIKQSKKDSQGFSFTNYEAFKNLNPAIADVTDKQEYFNHALREGYELVKANVSETQDYLKITQEMRRGSEHLVNTIYVDKKTNDQNLHNMYLYNEALRNGMVRSWGLGEAMKTAFEKAVTWSVVMGGMYGFLRLLQQIPATVTEIDTKLVEMSKVMSNDTNFSQVMDEMSLSANRFARTLTEVQDAVIEFAKQGYEAEQAVQMANNALLMANVTGMKTSESASYLTATMAQYNITAEESARITDKINEVDNRYAVTSTGLSQAIAKSGETAEQFGVTLDELLGYVTAVQTATRESGSVIGNSFKTLFSRISTDKAEKALTAVGVATKDVTGELRKGSDIYSDTANKWQSMTREQKAYVAEALAGRYHITRFMALMDNWNIATEATITSQQSLFSALEENRKHLQSLEAQMNLVKTSAQELAFTVGEAGLKKAMLAGLEGINLYIGGMTEFVKTTVFGKISILAFLAGFGITIFKLGSGIEVVKSLAIAFRGLASVMLLNPWGIAITSVIALASALAISSGQQKKFREEVKATKETVDDANVSMNELVEVTKKIGKPTLQNVNDLEGYIKQLEKVIDLVGKAKTEQIKKNQEMMQKLRDANTDMTAEQINNLALDDELVPANLSPELKDLAKSLGINVFELKSFTDFQNQANAKLKEFRDIVGQARMNSTEYQGTLIKSAQQHVDLAQTTVDLVKEYDKLSNVTNLNEQDSKRLVDVKNQLMAIFPQEFTNGNASIKLLTDEANKRLELANKTKTQTREQSIANLQALQVQYKTTTAKLALLDLEISKFNDLERIITSGKASLAILNKGTDLLVDQKSTRAEADDIANSIKEIQDLLFSSPTTTGISDSIKSETEKTRINVDEYKDLIIDAYNEVMNKASVIKLKVDYKLIDNPTDYYQELVSNQEQYVNTLLEAPTKLKEQMEEIKKKQAEMIRDKDSLVKSHGLDYFNEAYEEYNKQLAITQTRLDNINLMHSQAVGTLKQYKAELQKIQEATKNWEDISSKILSRYQELTQLKFDQSFDSFFNDKYKKYIDLLKEQPSDMVGVAQQKLKDLQDKMSNLLDLQKTLEKMKQEIQNDMNESDFDTKKAEYYQTALQFGDQKLADAIKKSKSMGEILGEINDWISKNNVELEKMPNEIKIAKEELEKLEKQAKVLDSFKDVLKNAFSFDSLWTDGVDEFGNTIHDVNGQVVKTLKDSAKVAEEVFNKIKESIANGFIEMIVDKDGLIDKLVSEGGFNILANSVEGVFSTVSTNWEQTLKNLGKSTTGYFASGQFGDAITKGMESMGNLDLILAQMLESSVTGIPEAITKIIERLPVLMNELNNNLIVGVSNSVVNALNEVRKAISNALNVDIPAIANITPTTNKIENTNTETTVYQASTPTNITYNYSVNAGNIIASKQSMRELAIELMEMMNEINQNKF